MKLRLVLAVMPAFVAAMAHATTAPAGSSDHLAVHVAGRITARCTLQAEGSARASFGSIMDMRTGRATAETLDLPVAVDCNAPYHAALFSGNGALKFEGSSVTGFADTVTYRAHLGMDAGTGAVALDCASADMVDAAKTIATAHCSAASTDVGGVSGVAKVHLTLDAGGEPLLRGTYSDTLTLLVSPNVGGDLG